MLPGSHFTPSGHARVAITGAGIITSMGVGWRANADGFRRGDLAFRKVSIFDASRQRIDRAGEVELPAELPATLLTAAQKRRVDRSMALVLHAAAEAWQQAGLQPGEWNGKVTPVSLGTSAGAMEVGEQYYKQAVATPGKRSGQPTRITQYQIRSQCRLLMAALGVQGSLTILSNACASGANSIGHAFELLRRGDAETALCGGYDALSEMVFAGFDSLQALSTGLPRPFDQHRDGLALGEGAGMFVLETFAHAQQRGATILAEICGYGSSTDLHHLTQPHPEGDAALLSMTQACEMAGISSARVGYINSHGTGTPLNDVAEARAIVRWAGAERAAKIAVSSTKASIGHLLGGAGSVESVICLMALREGWLPPTKTIRTLDPVCQFDVVREARDQVCEYVLTNSFGFGGANATLIFGRPETIQNTAANTASLQGLQKMVASSWSAVSPAGWTSEALSGAFSDKAAMPWKQEIRAEGAVETRVLKVPSPPSPQSFLRDPRLRRVSPIGKFSAAAAVAAMGEARIAACKAGSLRLGIIFSAFNGCVQYSRRFFSEVLQDPSTASPILFPETVFNAPASHLSALFGSPFRNYTLLSDSDGMLDAVAIAGQWLSENLADGVLVVAAEEGDWLSAEALATLQAGAIASEGAAAIYFEPVDANPEGILCRWNDEAAPELSPAEPLGNAMGASAGWRCVHALEQIRTGAVNQAVVASCRTGESSAAVVFEPNFQAMP